MKNTNVKKYCEYITNMNYTGNGYSYVIARGKYQGFNFLVVSCRGQHPCAYINVEKTCLNKKDYEKIDIYCHGDLTYSSDIFTLTGERGWWIGWDYGHCGDKIIYSNSLLNEKAGKEYTTEECVEECLNVIKQVKKLNKKNKKK